MRRLLSPDLLRSLRFAGYRLRIAHVVRDYGLTERDEAPRDSRAVNG